MSLAPTLLSVGSYSAIGLGSIIFLLTHCSKWPLSCSNSLCYINTENKVKNEAPESLLTHCWK